MPTTHEAQGVLQTKKITGTVSDAMGPIIGANVLEKGTTNGVITDIDGNFTLNVKPGATLVISYIGYVTQEVKTDNQTNLTITLKEDSEMLDEVVVVGYGTMKKSDLSGSSVSMGEEKIKGSVITSLDQSLQGRAAGVTAVTTSGAPGSSSSIRVRGQATINANAEPLYVIDGVIVQSGGQSGADYGLGDALGNGSVSTISPLSTINPSDIVSMEILKDASATAIYGAQGANGVVLITTKRGKSGEAKFTYDGMMAVNRQQRRLDLMNLREYAGYYQDLVNNGHISRQNADVHYSDPSLLGKGTNWQDAVFQTALQHQHQVSAEGGTDKVRYYVSGGYMNQEGTIIGSAFERFSVRTNLDAQLKEWLKLGLSATYSSTDEQLKLADSSEGIINYSLTTLPDIPIYDVDGNYASEVREGWTSPNPVAMAMLNEINLKRQKLTGNVFADITPMKNLTWHAELGYDISASKGSRFYPTVDLGGWTRDSNSASVQKNSSTFWQLKNYVTYNGEIGKHYFTAMVGQECWESSYDFNSVTNTNLPSNDIHNPALGQGTPSINTGFGSSAMASFFTRETYNYDNRYYATYTYRYDGSSNFGPKNRWAGFHSLAGSWRFTNEAFLRDVPWLSNGKLRVGWGQTGNANIGGSSWLATMSRMPTGLGLSYRPANIANEAVKWESQEQWNIGLDLSFLQDRISLTFDWYRKESKDMLMTMQLPSYMGTQGNASSALSAPKGNYGTLRNYGFEITLNVRPIVTKNFDWSSDIQFSINRNKLVALQGTASAAIVGYGQWSDVVSMSTVGESLYNFYGYVVEGVYKDFNDIITSPISDKAPLNADGTICTDPSKYNKSNTVWVGDLKFKDVNGDGRITEADKTNIGSPLPKFTFGWTNTFHYKNFDASIFVNGSVGNKVMNYTAINLTAMKTAWSNQLNAINARAQLGLIDGTKVYGNGDYWYNDIANIKVMNPGTSVPRAAINDPNDNDRISDRYIEDGSYIRLKNISLGYSFPKKTIRRLGLSNLRLSANIQNLLTITGYNGYDPEIGASTSDMNGYVYGMDNGRYPSPVTYSFGLNVSF
ncbi:MAG: SusC/RagA family TonB-linked outer membrane protein [Bacteroides sp.]